MTEDNDLENQISVRVDDDMYREIVEASDKFGTFKGKIVRQCIRRCIMQDHAPKWKRFIVKLIGY